MVPKLNYNRFEYCIGNFYCFCAQVAWIQAQLEYMHPVLIPPICGTFADTVQYHTCIHM